MGYYESEKDIVKDFNMVWQAIHKYKFEPNEDIFQIGCIGLLKASRAYDPTKNYTFSTLAYRCIKNEILMFLRKEGKQIKCYSIFEENAITEQGNVLTKEIFHTSHDSYCFKNLETIIQEVIEVYCKDDTDKRIFTTIYLNRLHGEWITQATMSQKYNVSRTKLYNNMRAINSVIKRKINENTQ